MPASEAQIRANKLNALKSTGPKTEEGKAASRGNSYKHGLTATKLLPECEAAEVEHRSLAFYEELKPSGELGQVLVRRAATLSVRMERCVAHENAAITAKVRQALADFEAPEGVTDPAELARLRQEVEALAVFDASNDAALARKYEAAAERGFFRCLKELRQIEGAAKAAESEAMDELSREVLASFSQMKEIDAEFDALLADDLSSTPRNRFATASKVAPPVNPGRNDVPFAVGRPR